MVDKIASEYLDSPAQWSVKIGPGFESEQQLNHRDLDLKSLPLMKVHDGGGKKFLEFLSPTKLEQNLTTKFFLDPPPPTPVRFSWSSIEEKSLQIFSLSVEWNGNEAISRLRATKECTNMLLSGPRSNLIFESRLN